MRRVGFGLIALLVTGYMMMFTSGIGGPTTIIGDFTYRGNLRAISEIALGAVCFESAAQLRQYQYTRLGQLLLGALEAAAYAISIWYMVVHEGSKYDYYILLLLAVGVSFVTGPADLMQSLTGWDKTWWLYIIFVYYILATLLPIDKIIGSIYPFMGAALLFMAVGVGGAMLAGDISGSISMPELTPHTLKNYHSDPQDNILIPMLFIVISCGAISGFHSTQSPLMSRCLKNEKYGRPVFYGAMIAEGIVAMIWASAAMAYFGGPEGLNKAAAEGIMIDGVLTQVTPAIAVDMICKSWLGKVGAVIAVVGVVVCPITSGDTAFRSMRLTLADLFRYDQKKIANRLVVSVPVFIVAYFCCMMDFSTIWNYVGICNQILAALVLWTVAAYLMKSGKPHWMASVPATFLTFVCVSYFMIAPYRSGGLHLDPAIGYVSGAVVALSVFACCIIMSGKRYKGVAG